MGLLLCRSGFLTGAWGELMYEEILLNDPDHQGDIDTAPTDGFDDKRGEVSAVSTVSKVDLSAPIRFSQASFMQIERERADHGKSFDPQCSFLKRRYRINWILM